MINLIQRITNKIYQELCDVSKATATRDLTELIDKHKLLKRTGEVGAGTAYKLIGSNKIIITQSYTLISRTKANSTNQNLSISISLPTLLKRKYGPLNTKRLPLSAWQPLQSIFQTKKHYDKKRLLRFNYQAIRIVYDC